MRQLCVSDAETMSRTSRPIITLRLNPHWRLSSPPACSAGAHCSSGLVLGPVPAQGRWRRLSARGARSGVTAASARTHQVHGVWGGLTDKSVTPLWSVVLVGSSAVRPPR